MLVRLPAIMVALTVGLTEGPASAADNRAAYEAARKQAGTDAPSQVRLALWCEAHGMTAERVKHLTTAVLADPANTLARGLMGLVERGGKWERPEDVSREAKEDPRLKTLRDEYFQRRAKTPDKADDQWKLAAWCEQHGLKEEAVAHYHAVLRLDPRREAVWKHLGFKKVGGRWALPEQIEAEKQEAAAQARADRHWKPLLERWRAGLSSRDKSRRAHAEASLSSVTDPRAVPMIWAVFAQGGEVDQKAAIRVLASVDSPGSSRALAMLAVHARTAELRRAAAEVLRQRDPRDYLDLLIRMVRDPLRYEIRPGAEPNSPGELFIEGRRYNVRRQYMISEENGTFNLLTQIPPRLFAPSVPFDPFGNQTLGPGMQGMMWGAGPWVVPQPAVPSLPATANPQAAATLGTISKAIKAGMPSTSAVASVPSAQELAVQRDFVIAERLAFLNQVVEMSRQQLRNDISVVENYNADVRRVNNVVVPLLNYLTGVDIGGSGEDWQAWWTDQRGYAYSAADPNNKPTYDSIVMNPFVLPHHACFAAGTRVRTLDGPKAIETILAGDQVLAQDLRTGALAFTPVVAVFHNKPAATLRIGLGGETIVATGIHRFWKAGTGWAMARDLKVGDVLRILGGTARVVAVATDAVQPVFNLEVANGHSFFVGEAGALVHDNSTVEPVERPFDAANLPATAQPPGEPAVRRSMLGR